MARAKRQTKTEKAAVQAEAERSKQDAVEWIEGVTDSIEQIVETVNGHAAAGNKLAERVSDHEVRVESNTVLLQGLRVDLKLLRAELNIVRNDLRRAKEQVAGLEAFERAQHIANDHFQSSINGVRTYTRNVDNAVYELKHPASSWQRLQDWVRSFYA